MTVRVWARKLFVDTLEETVFGRFIGEGSDSLIQLKTDLKKDKGDNIRVGLRMQLSGDGVQGDGTLEGNEEALILHADTVYLDQLRHAVRSSGKMSEQRVRYEHREEAEEGLRDWWAGRLDSFERRDAA